MTTPPRKPQRAQYRLHPVRGGYEAFGDRSRGGFCSTGRTWVPAADICDAAEELIIRLDLAGIDPAELSLIQIGDELIVQGQRLRDPDGDAHPYLLVEIPAGPFERRFELPCHLDLSTVEAHYKDGILRIAIRKASRPARQSRFVKIQIEEKA